VKVAVAGYDELLLRMRQKFALKKGRFREKPPRFFDRALQP
jgi:hypothetical protein